MLKYYPAVIPDDATLDRWQRSEWPDYQQWIDRHSILSSDQWKQLNKHARKANGKVKISIVTPVYNTSTSVLMECILSVRTQTSPYWQLILIDDGSTKEETLHVLRSPICRDPRIQILFSDNSSSGISAATNRGIDAATGDYIVFLDHDDRIAPQAIQMLTETIENDPDVDILYSDRDMISLGDKRFMHLMKPDWSPDNLYGGNYIFHLMCYRRDLVIRAGKLRSAYDGSQDYDLILRCMEFDPKVTHLPHVLYHWRQHEESVALDDKAKSFAFEAGMAALRDALRRRNIQAVVKENKSLWRGNYQIELTLPEKNQIGFITIPGNLEPERYTQTVLNNPVLQNPPPYIFVQWEGCNEKENNSARILASWLTLENIGIASGCLIDKDEKFVYAGMIYNEEGQVVAPYSDYEYTEPGYLAATKSARNISAPNPYSVMIKRELWQDLNGFAPQFNSPIALLDFALTALQSKWRIVYVPLAEFVCIAPPPLKSFPQNEQREFSLKWQKWLKKGDPHYSVNLSTESNIYELT